MSAQVKPLDSSNSMQRVKVYRLTADGKWEDYGTGYITVDCIERSEDPSLRVIDEQDNDPILVHQISPEDIYRRHEATIINWKDLELSTELALSFEEASGCSYIWDLILELQRNLQSHSLGGLDVAKSSSVDVIEDPGFLQSDDESSS